MRRIDVHAHAFPAALLRELARHYPSALRPQHPGPDPQAYIWHGVPLPVFDIEQRLQAMEQDGVEQEILSAPPIYGAFDTQTAAICTLTNELQAGLAREYPRHFRSFIHLPLHQPELAQAELLRWRSEPSTAGVVIPSNVAGSYPGDAGFEWLWSDLAAVRLPVFIHPVAPCGLASPVAPPVLHFPNDTAVAATTLIYQGILERYPELEFILPHCGGTLPLLARRLDMVLHPHFPPHVAGGLPQPPSEYVRRFHVDTAQAFDRSTFDCAVATFGMDHILYGSDLFLRDTPWRRELNNLLDQALSGELQRYAVLRGNAERLLLSRARMSLQPKRGVPA